MAETIVVTGGTGLIGIPLCRLLVDAGHNVRCLTRSDKPHPVAGVQTFRWNVEAGQIDDAALQEATVVVHLAGENIAGGRWTPARKAQIMDSRIRAAYLLKAAIDRAQAPVHTVVGASAIGFYNLSKRQVDESGKAGADFPAEVCIAWEQATQALAAGRRLVIFRIGNVLSRAGGVFQRLAQPFSFGLGAWLGNGLQPISWIHVRDMAGLIAFAIGRPSMEGVYNGVANEPVNLKFLVKQMGRYLHKPVMPIGVPGFVLELAFGEMAQIVLTGNTVISTRLQGTGYKFRYPHLYDALAELTRKKKGS